MPSRRALAPQMQMPAANAPARWPPAARAASRAKPRGHEREQAAGSARRPRRKARAESQSEQMNRVAQQSNARLHRDAASEVQVSARCGTERLTLAPANDVLAGDELTDTPDRACHTPPVRPRPLCTRRRRRKAELVVVAAAERVRERHLRWKQRQQLRRERHALDIDGGTAAAGAADVAEIGEQPVGNVDRRSAQAARARAPPPRAAWEIKSARRARRGGAAFDASRPRRATRTRPRRRRACPVT